MSSGLDFRIERSLGLLARLRQTTAQFAEKEESLSRDLATRRHAIGRSAEGTEAAAEETHAARLAQTDDYCRAEAQRLQAIGDARLKRGNRYVTTYLRRLPDLVQDMKRKWLGDLQMKNYAAERRMAAELSAADADTAGFSAKLQEHGKNLLELERRARTDFSGYLSLRARLRKPKLVPLPEDASMNQLLAQIDELFTDASTNLAQVEDFSIPRFFRSAPLWLAFLIFAAIGAGLIGALGANPTSYALAGSCAAIFVVIWIVHLVGYSQIAKPAKTAAHALVQIRSIIQSGQASGPALAAKREGVRREIEDEYQRARAGIDQDWGRADDVVRQFEQSRRLKLDKQLPRIAAKIQRTLQAKLAALETQRLAWHEQLNAEVFGQQQQIAGRQETERAALAEMEHSRWAALTAEWHAAITPIWQEIADLQSAAAADFPAWDHALVETWRPAPTFSPAMKFGRLDLDLSKSPSRLPKDPRLALPGPPRVSVPLALSFPSSGSLLLETKDSGDASVIATLNNVILRLLASMPPGHVVFTIIDPVGLGQNFSGLMHLADYEESVINRRIWTQRDQIEERLAELAEHIEKVIQMYLRNEYATITEYNAKAGSVAEKYHFLVVADFPVNFSDVATKRLQSIAQIGARCGVFTLIHWDQRQPKPDGFVPDELRKGSLCLQRTPTGFVLDKRQSDMGATLVLDQPADPGLAVELVHKIGKSSIDSNRVEVPFSQVAPAAGQEWTGDTTSELRVAVGRTGATKLQYLAMGKGTRQHALFAGKTGSGKSTLFHVIITNLALTCSPDQVQFYLIDFKKGVEFKCYASRHLPHARVVAIESDREFALSVLQDVDEELRRRGDIFRRLGVQDVPGYKRANATEPMPRLLLIIDEFQEFFVQDDAVAQTASLLFDRIVRQGRAFGIHVLLGSQTLGGAYSLARATLGQMAIRVALQCNEADAYLIMDENNAAPRLLSRPGEGIYNDASGAIEGNSPFQVVWLPDAERDVWLDKVETLSAQSGKTFSTPIVFEGNAPAEIRENNLLRAALDSTPAAAPSLARCWLGAPNSIKGPTEVVFRRQSGSHLLIVGQRDETAATMLGLSMLALAAQYPRGGVKFVLFDNSPPASVESALFEQVAKAIPHELVTRHGQDIGAALNDVAAELAARTASETHSHDAPAVFLFVHGLHKFKKLRAEDDFSFSTGDADAAPNPATQFGQIVTEGAGYGIHLVVTIDTLNSVNRFLNRKALSEFEMRVLFQMSANDSASLIDSPKASDLGLYRALFYNEHEGSLETFRPYATPDAEWLDLIAEKLKLR